MEIKDYLKLLALISINIAFVCAFIFPLKSLAFCLIYICCGLSDIRIFNK